MAIPVVRLCSWGKQKGWGWGWGAQSSARRLDHPVVVIAADVIGAPVVWEEDLSGHVRGDVFAAATAAAVASARSVAEVDDEIGRGERGPRDGRHLEH